ncbi:MAG: hypothetical protein WC694_01870 [Candidatus Paceibacterota bacterium]|jgi:hypothetical protein
MKKTKTIRFVESFVILPIMTMMTPFGTIPNNGFNVVNQPQVAITAPAKDQQIEQALKLKANAIDAYFAEHDMPLKGTGMKMVEEAEKNDLDWRLLPSIAVRESTGGKFACKKVKNNPFGWGSCKIGFKSVDSAIETVARNLGGNNPRTAKHYDDKNTKGILHAYNPPSIVLKYAEQVIAIMDDIGDADLIVTPNLTT